MINIKGMNNNLIFIFKKGCFHEYRDNLLKKFTDNHQLFYGSKVIFKGEGLDSLSHGEIASLQKLCLENGMILNNTGGLGKTKDKYLTINRNVRSGQKFYSEGSIVVWGDVHESAELVAVKNIIVLGKLAGIVHAGYYGNNDSIVFALNLSPSQIRIADVISRSPKDYVSNPYPEIAYLENNNIYIKQYLMKDSQLRI